MLHSVPAAISRMARNVVINHPNAFNCQVFRKTITRPNAEDGGLPVMGGLGMLDGGDEEQFTYAWLGNGFAVQVDSFQPSLMMDRGDANNGTTNESRFLIEGEEPDGTPGSFEPKNSDVLYLLLGSGDSPAKLAFEIVGVEAALNIPPYTTRYVANRRDDLHVAAGS